MWKTIKDFSDYVISDSGYVYRLSTGQLLDTRVVSLKRDDGIWRNKTVNSLLKSTFNKKHLYISAYPINDTTDEIYFSSIKEAALWLINTKQAITAGKLAAYQTVRTNIRNGIKQPELYPYVYGYIWKQTKE